MIVLEDNGVENLIKTTILPPQYSQQLAQHNKNDIKANLIQIYKIKFW